METPPEQKMPVKEIHTPQDAPQPFWKRHAPMLLVVAFAMLVRLCGLTYYALDWDESNTLAIARLPIAELLHVIAVRDIHPPASHILEHFWIGLFGSTDLTVRALFALYGLLGVWGSYLLARQISGSRQIGWLTALLTVLSPLVFHYGYVATHHGFFYTGIIFSWYFLLRVLAMAPERPWYKSVPAWGYILTTWMALFTQSIAPAVLIFQAVYVFWHWKTIPPALRKFLGVLFALYVLSFVPEVWLFSQPWHASKMTEMSQMHAAPNPLALLLTPANFLWIGSDQLMLTGDTPPETLFLYGLGGTILLGFTAWLMKKRRPGLLLPTACIGLLPPLLLFALCLLLRANAYQYRAILFVAFSVNFLLAFALDWLIAVKKSQLALLVLIGLLWLQGLASLEAYRKILGLPLAQAQWTAQFIHDYSDPQDGYLIYPGLQHLQVLRYQDPDQWGLTEHERHMDPRHENVTHMVSLINDKYFLVTGEDVLRRPDIQEKLHQFIKKHPRVWALWQPMEMKQYLSCDTTWISFGADGRFWQFRCPFDHPDHCAAPLVGEGANHWYCPHHKK